MEVWLLESIYGEEEYQEILLHMPNSNLWLGNTGVQNERVEELRFTDKFWRSKEDLLTYLGEL